MFKKVDESEVKHAKKNSIDSQSLDIVKEPNSAVPKRMVVELSPIMQLGKSIATNSQYNWSFFCDKNSADPTEGEKPNNSKDTLDNGDDSKNEISYINFDKPFKITNINMNYDEIVKKILDSKGFQNFPNLIKGI